MKIANFEQGTAVVKKSYSGFGKAMMSKMGWSEGEGLGKNKQGMAEAIKVKKRQDQEGLGAEEMRKYDWTNKWWEGSFNSAADKFAELAKSLEMNNCLLYTSPSPRDRQKSRMPSSA